MRKKGEPDCQSCTRIPVPMESVQEVWTLFQITLPGLIRGDWSIDFQAIKVVMDIYEIPQNLRADILQEIVLCGAILVNARRPKEPLKKKKLPRRQPMKAPIRGRGRRRVK